MPQLFPRWLNKLPLYAAIGGMIVPVVAIAGIWYYGSPKFTDVGYSPAQPVPYSHRLHVGELGLDCRYCHASVEVSAVANGPRQRRRSAVTWISEPARSDPRWICKT